MASQSFNLIGQEEEQELVAFETRQSRGPTPQSRPNSRMEEMLYPLIKSQAATAKSLENRMVENARSLEAKVSELAKSQSELIHSHTSPDDKLAQIAYTQCEQIAEMSDLVDRMSTVERSLQGSLVNSEKSNSAEACLDGQRALHSSFDHPLVTCPVEVQNGQVVQSTTADSCPFTQKPTLRDETESKLI